MKNVLLSRDILQLEILLADDDKDTASAYSMALEDIGLHVPITLLYNDRLQDIRLNHPSGGKMSLPLSQLIIV
jgi:hypothetical protein